MACWAQEEVAVFYLEVTADEGCRGVEECWHGLLEKLKPTNLMVREKRVNIRDITQRVDNSQGTQGSRTIQEFAFHGQS